MRKYVYLTKNNLLLALNLISIFIIIFLSPIFLGNKRIVFLIFQIIILFISLMYNQIKAREFYFLIYSLILLFIYILMNGENYLNVIIKVYINLVVYYIVYLNFKILFRLDNNINKIIKYISLLGFIISIYSIFEYIAKSNQLFVSLFNSKYSTIYSSLESNHFYLNTGLYRVSASFQHPIIVANIGIFLSYISILGYLINKEKKYLIYYLSNIVMLYLTFSRSSYLAIIITTFLFFLIILFKVSKTYSMKKYIRYILKVGIGIGVILILINIRIKGKDSLLESIISRFMQLFSDSDSGSLYQRTYSMKYVINKIKEDNNLFKLLLGNGYGTLSYYLQLFNIIIYGKGYYVIDNQYFTSLYEVGVINLTLFAAILIKNTFEYFKILINKYNDENIIKLTISFLIIISFIISFFMYDGLTWLSIVYFLGISVALFSTYKEKF